MSNRLVKHDDIREIFNTLWTRIKNKLTDYLKKNEDATLTGKITLVNPYINGDSLIDTLADKPSLTKQNEFKNLNDFADFTPTITKDFIVSAHGTDLANLMEYNDDKYIYTTNYKSNSAKGYTSLFIPIANAQPKDKVEISYFVVNADTSRVVEEVVKQECEILDRKFLGYYCAKVPLRNNNAYAHNVGFGFKITQKTIGNRTLKLVYANGTSGGTTWTDITEPSNGAYLAPAISYAFPYLTGVHTTSALVTRFDIENNTPNITF